MRVRDDRSIPCPCCDCQNVRREITVEAIKEHLITRGFVKGYNRWVMHGESKEDACNIARPSGILPDNISDNSAGNVGCNIEVGEDLGAAPE